MKTKSFLSLTAVAVLPGMAFAQSFLVDPSNTSNHALEVAPGGNIGIGTPTPSTRLALAGDEDTIRFSLDDGQLYTELASRRWGMSYGLLFNAAKKDAAASVNGNLFETGNTVYKHDGSYFMSAAAIGGYLNDPAGGKIRIYGAPPATAGANVVWTMMAEFGLGRKVSLTPRGIESDFFLNYNGNVGIGTSNPQMTLHVDGGSDRSGGLLLETSAHGKGAFVRFKDNSDGGLFTHVIGQETALPSGYLTGDTARALVIAAYGPNPIEFGVNDHVVMAIVNGGNVGIGTKSPTAKLEVVGTIKCQVVDLSGADLAEKFDVAGEFVPGMVVCPDPANEGKLHVCAREYDRSAIGVLSGAGGINTGLVLHQPGTAAEGAHAVAMTGRVYVWADASHGAIKPGDELTSAATPGHAMKATDDTRANRAVLGTALTSLKQGRGLVLTALQRR